MLDKIFTLFFVILGVACAIFGITELADGIGLLAEPDTNAGSGQGVISDQDQDAFGQVIIGLIIIVVGLVVAAFPFLGRMLEAMDQQQREFAQATAEYEEPLEDVEAAPEDEEVEAVPETEASPEPTASVQTEPQTDETETPPDPRQPDRTDEKPETTNFAFAPAAASSVISLPVRGMTARNKLLLCAGVVLGLFFIYLLVQQR